MDNKTFGYLRVSTREQSLDRQRVSIIKYCKEHNIKIDEERDIFEDKLSGKDFERPQYKIMKQCLRSGDVLIIKELDRLGRNKEQIKKELTWFRENKIKVKILNIPTTLEDLSADNSWVMDMVNNILIEVYSALAEEERLKIRRRQSEGIAVMPVDASGKKISKKTGRYTGRPVIEYPKNWNEVYTDWKEQKITGVQAMKLLDLKKGTFYNMVKKYESEI